ncbi:MAG: CDP-alcohol phosphatidyltransferase family protein [Roseicyclus sp.]
MTYVRSSRPKRIWPAAAALVASPAGEFATLAVALAAGALALEALAFGAGSVPAALAVAAFAAGAAAAGRALHLRYPHPHLGLCNAITLLRLALTMSLLAPLLAGDVPSWAFFAVAVIALGLDGVDGWFARRQGYVSEFGARFDMEVDSVLALILAASAAVASGLGPLALLLGMPRYAFAAAALVLPWMRRDLPERFSRKVVCVIQLGVLIALQAPILPGPLAVALVLGAAAALIWSFAVDLAWLRQRA